MGESEERERSGKEPKKKEKLRNKEERGMKG